MKISETRLPGVFVIEPIQGFFETRTVIFSKRGVTRPTPRRASPTPSCKTTSRTPPPECSAACICKPPRARRNSSQCSPARSSTWPLTSASATTTFGQWVGLALSADDHRQLYIPQGFAHGFVVTAGPAVVTYKVNVPYAPADELTIAWDDPNLAINWPVATPILSGKDREGRRLDDIPATACRAIPRNSEKTEKEDGHGDHPTAEDRRRRPEDRQPARPRSAWLHVGGGEGSAAITLKTFGVA